MVVVMIVVFLPALVWVQHPFSPVASGTGLSLDADTSGVGTLAVATEGPQEAPLLQLPETPELRAANLVVLTERWPCVGCPGVGS
jgi:hypothetical protein